MIPSGAYVDIDSLKGHATHTIARTAFNVEAPKELSKNTPLYVCSKRVLRKNFIYNEHLELPIHLRYHAATGEDATVVVPAPQLLLRCSENATFMTPQCRKKLIKASCDCSTTSTCEWFLMPLLEYNSVLFKVPTGNGSSFQFILFMSLFVIVSCIVAVVVATLKNNTKLKIG